jgi:hypothetical protein
MSKVVLDVSMSLDGFTAGGTPGRPDRSEGMPVPATHWLG